MYLRSILSFMLLAILAAITFTACNIKQEHQVDEIGNYTVEINRPVTIQNLTKLTLSWDGLFKNMDSLLAKIKTMKADYPGEPLQRKSWRFVISNLDFYRNPLESREIHHPLTQLNSIGYGQCDDLATCLYFIWREQGFKSRIWGLGNHVVPEVYANGKWQMYDPAFQSYYLNREGLPAGVQELTAQNNLILHPIESLFIKESNNIPSHIMDSLRYGMNVCRHYLSSKNHFINQSYNHTFDVKDFFIQVPISSTIILPVYKPELMHQVDWFGNTLNNNYYLKLTLPANCTGTIRMPLVLIALEGNALLFSSQKNDTIKIFGNKNTSPLDIIDTALSIVSVQETTNLYYKLPKRFANPIDITISAAKLKNNIMN